MIKFFLIKILYNSRYYWIISPWNIWRYFKLEFHIYFLNLIGFLLIEKRQIQSDKLKIVIDETD